MSVTTLMVQHVLLVRFEKKDGAHWFLGHCAFVYALEYTPIALMLLSAAQGQCSPPPPAADFAKLGGGTYISRCEQRGFAQFPPGSFTIKGARILYNGPAAPSSNNAEGLGLYRGCTSGSCALAAGVPPVLFEGKLSGDFDGWIAKGREQVTRAAIMGRAAPLAHSLMQCSELLMFGSTSINRNAAVVGTSCVNPIVVGSGSSYASVDAAASVSKRGRNDNVGVTSAGRSSSSSITTTTLRGVITKATAATTQVMVSHLPRWVPPPAQTGLRQKSAPSAAAAVAGAVTTTSTTTSLPSVVLPSIVSASVSAGCKKMRKRTLKGVKGFVARKSSTAASHRRMQNAKVSSSGMTVADQDKSASSYLYEDEEYEDTSTSTSSCFFSTPDEEWYARGVMMNDHPNELQRALGWMQTEADVQGAPEVLDEMPAYEHCVFDVSDTVGGWRYL